MLGRFTSPVSSKISNCIVPCLLDNPLLQRTPQPIPLLTAKMIYDIEDVSIFGKIPRGEKAWD